MKKIKNNFSLPSVGDRLMRIMSGSKSANYKYYEITEPCTVVYVNKDKAYYTVQFIKTGIRESYKVPEVDELKLFKNDYKRMFGYEPKGVYVYESGLIYPSISECARAIGVTPGSVSNHIHGRLSHIKGYHIYLL